MTSDELTRFRAERSDWNAFPDEVVLKSAEFQWWLFGDRMNVLVGPALRKLNTAAENIDTRVRAFFR